MSNRQKLIIFSLIIFLALTIHISVAQDNLIIPGERIGPYTLDMSADYIESWLGTPTHKEYHSNGQVSLLYYENYRMDFYYNPDGTTFLIVTFSSSYVTQEGISPGMHFSKIVDSYDAKGQKVYAEEREGYGFIFGPELDINYRINVDTSIIESISVQHKP